MKERFGAFHREEIHVAYKIKEGEEIKVKTETILEGQLLPREAKKAMAERFFLWGTARATMREWADDPEANNPEKRMIEQTIYRKIYLVYSIARGNSHKIKMTTIEEGQGLPEGVKKKASLIAVFLEESEADEHVKIWEQSSSDNDKLRAKVNYVVEGNPEKKQMIDLCFNHPFCSEYPIITFKGTRQDTMILEDPHFHIKTVIKKDGSWRKQPTTWTIYGTKTGSEIHSGQGYGIYDAWFRTSIGSVYNKEKGEWE